MLPTLKERLGSLLLLTLLGAMAFAPTLDTPMLYDDDHAVVNHPKTRSLEPYPEAFHPREIFNRPVLMFTFALNRVLGGEEVFGYHLVNVALHIGVALVFYSLLWSLMSLTGDLANPVWRRVPLWASLLFLLHPLAVEPVAYISSRSSVLATLFYLLALWNMIRFYQKEPSRGFGGLENLILFLFFFYLGCGTKAIIVTLPVMIVLFLWMAHPEDFFNRRGLECLLILFPLLLYMLWRAQVLGDPLSLDQDPSSRFISRKLYFLTQIKYFVFYFWLKFLLPFNQNFEPDIRLVTGWGDPGLWAALVAVVGAAVGVVRYFPRLFWFWGLWTVITLAPTSSLVPLKQIITEHRFYLPGLGLSVLVAGLWSRVAAQRPWARRGFYAMLVLLFLLTQNRAQDFQSAIRLWEDTARKSPNKPLVHNNLATEYLGAGRFEDARRELETTLRLDPAHRQARINLGVLYARTGRKEKALEIFQALLKEGGRDPVVFYNAGLVLREMERPEEALPLLEKAVELKPDNADYQFLLGQTYQALKRFDEALSAYRKSLKLNPDNPKAHVNMGTIFWEQKHFYFADAAFRRAYELAPESTLVLSNLVSSNMVFQNYDQAIELLEEWLKLEPDNPNARQLLTAARRLQKIPKKTPEPPAEKPGTP